MVLPRSSDELPHAATVSTGSSWVFTFGRDCNGELGRPPLAGALDATGNPATGHPAAGALDAATPAPGAIEPETDPVKAQLKGDPRCVTQLSDLPNGIVSVGSGFYHSAAVSSSGELYTWGAGSGGQLGRTRGNGSKSVGVCAAPAPIPSLQSKQEHVLRVVGGRNHTVALSAPGRGFTWGRNMHGQLGHPPVAGATRRAEAHVLEPRHLRSLDARGRLAEVSCGEYNTAALTQQGEVLTWGRTANGRSGTGRLATALTEPCALPRRAFGGVAVSSLALGWCVPLAHWRIGAWCIGALVHWRIGALAHWCGPLMHVALLHCYRRHCLARTREGLLYSWGSGEAGQLGLEECRDRNTPQLIEALAREKVMLLAAGGAHSLAVTKEGVVFSWGEGSQGQLGLGACHATARPQGIASLLEQSPVVGLGAGGSHSCFITSSGEQCVVSEQ